MTIFEKIIARGIPATIVYEDDRVIAFRDTDPKAPVHILIVPKRVIRSVNELNGQDGSLIAELILVAKQVAESEKISGSGYRLVINCNSDGGQSVDHLHIHLLGGRKMVWPPG